MSLQLHVSPEQPPLTQPEALELQAIDRQEGRFKWLSLGTIIVSFIHMVTALSLFSGASIVEQFAAAGMTGLVDYATWVVASNIDYAKRRKLTRSAWIMILFYFALGISMFLNGAYLWSHRPPADVIPTWMSIGITVCFAGFIPLSIGVSSKARGELEDDRVRQELNHAKRIQKDAMIPEVRIFRPDESTAVLPASLQANEVFYLPETKPARGSSNNKSGLMTTDIPGILSALQAANVTRFRFASDLGKVCGWSSPSSSTKALALLRESGAIREAEGWYEVMEPIVETPRSFVLEDLLSSADMTVDQARTMIQRYGLSTPDKAYSALRSYNKLPDGLTQAEFVGLYQQLMEA